MSFWFDPMVQTVGMPGYGGGPQINTDYGGQLAQQQAYVAAQNQAALKAAAPMPPGYGQVHLPYLSGSFGPAAASGTYSPGSGLSSFSGVSLGGGGGGGQSVFDTGADPWNPYASQLAQQGGGYSGGGIGSDAYRGGQGGNYGVPMPRLPAISQDWNSTFNNMTAGNSYNPYSLGDASWYPSQRQQPAAPDYSAWYSGLPGGSQAYNSWNMGLPAQGGFGVPGSGNGGGSWLDMYNRGNAAALAGQQGGGGAWATGTPQGTREPVPDVRTYMPSGQFGGYLDHYLWGANSGSLGARGIMADPFGGYVPQGGANDPWNPYAAQLAQQGGYSGGGIGSDARYGGQNALAGYGSALDMLRGGQGWTIANTPQAVSQETLGNRINQGIYDIGNAGDYYSRSIGGGFGMNMPNQSQALTAQDMAAPHAYPGGFRMDQQ